MSTLTKIALIVLRAHSSTHLGTVPVVFLMKSSCPISHKHSNPAYSHSANGAATKLTLPDSSPASYPPILPQNLRGAPLVYTDWHDSWRGKGYLCRWHPGLGISREKSSW